MGRRLDPILRFQGQTLEVRRVLNILLENNSLVSPHIQSTRRCPLERWFWNYCNAFQRCDYIACFAHQDLRQRRDLSANHGADILYAL